MLSQGIVEAQDGPMYLACKDFSSVHHLECPLIILMLKTHKQRPQVFLLSWYSSLKTPVYKIPWKAVPPQVLSGQARRSRKRTHLAPSWLSCLCLSIGVVVLWSHKNHCWFAMVGELRATFSLEREGGTLSSGSCCFCFHLKNWVEAVHREKSDS